MKKPGAKSDTHASQSSMESATLAHAIATPARKRKQQNLAGSQPAAPPTPPPSAPASATKASASDDMENLCPVCDDHCTCASTSVTKDESKSIVPHNSRLEASAVNHSAPAHHAPSHSSSQGTSSMTAGSRPKASRHARSASSDSGMRRRFVLSGSDASGDETSYPARRAYGLGGRAAAHDLDEQKIISELACAGDPFEKLDYLLYSTGHEDDEDDCDSLASEDLTGRNGSSRAMMYFTFVPPFKTSSRHDYDRGYEEDVEDDDDADDHAVDAAILRDEERMMRRANKKMQRSLSAAPAKPIIPISAPAFSYSSLSYPPAANYPYTFASSGYAEEMQAYSDAALPHMQTALESDTCLSTTSLPAPQPASSNKRKKSQTTDNGTTASKTPSAAESAPAKKAAMANKFAKTLSSVDKETLLEALKQMSPEVFTSVSNSLKKKKKKLDKKKDEPCPPVVTSALPTAPRLGMQVPVSSIPPLPPMDVTPASVLSMSSEPTSTSAPLASLSGSTAAPSSQHRRTPSSIRAHGQLAAESSAAGLAGWRVGTQAREHVESGYASDYEAEVVPLTIEDVLDPDALVFFTSDDSDLEDTLQTTMAGTPACPEPNCCYKNATTGRCELRAQRRGSASLPCPHDTDPVSRWDRIPVSSFRRSRRHSNPFLRISNAFKNPLSQVDPWINDIYPTYEVMDVDGDMGLSIASVFDYKCVEPILPEATELTNIYIEW